MTKGSNFFLFLTKAIHHNLPIQIRKLEISGLSGEGIAIRVYIFWFAQQKLYFLGPKNLQICDKSMKSIYVIYAKKINCY